MSPLCHGWCPSRHRSSWNYLHRFRIQFMIICNNFEQCFNFCLNNCFLFEQCAREGASPAASWHLKRWVFDFGKILCLETCFGTHVFTQRSVVGPTCIPKGIQHGPPKTSFWNVARSAFRSSRLERTLYRASKKVAQIQSKNEGVSRTMFFTQKVLKDPNKDFQKVPKWMTLFWWWRLLGHLWRPSLIFHAKSASKILQKWTQGSKSYPKRVPKWSKCVQNRSRFWNKG